MLTVLQSTILFVFALKDDLEVNRFFLLSQKQHSHAETEGSRSKYFFKKYFIWVCGKAQWTLVGLEAQTPGSR